MHNKVLSPRKMLCRLVGNLGDSGSVPDKRKIMFFKSQSNFKSYSGNDGLNRSLFPGSFPEGFMKRQSTSSFRPSFSIKDTVPVESDALPYVSAGSGPVAAADCSYEVYGGSRRAAREPEHAARVSFGSASLAESAYRTGDVCQALGGHSAASVPEHANGESLFRVSSPGGASCAHVGYPARGDGVNSALAAKGRVALEVPSVRNVRFAPYVGVSVSRDGQKRCSAHSAEQAGKCEETDAVIGASCHPSQLCHFCNSGHLCQSSHVHAHASLSGVSVARAACAPASAAPAACLTVVPGAMSYAEVAAAACVDVAGVHDTVQCSRQVPRWTRGTKGGVTEQSEDMCSDPQGTEPYLRAVGHV